MADIQNTNSSTLSVINSKSGIINTYDLTLAVYNKPADYMHTFQAFADAVMRQLARVEVTQAYTLAVVRGVIDNPKLTTWYFTLDGHDFYVLKLGTKGKTLIFDLSTGQWAWWSGNGVRWRTTTGLNWRSSGKIPSISGSNIIAGDDSSGTLWVLDPEKKNDDTLGTVPTTFPRVATGQMVTNERNFIPVYYVAATVTRGYPESSTNSVTLQYSDDQGRSFVIADEPQVMRQDDADQELIWRSLGQVKAPGRLFQIKDDGAFARLDYMHVNDD